MAAATMSSTSDGQTSKVNVERCQNFMRQFRDPTSREVKKLTANQFMDVWNHYDKDGKIKTDSQQAVFYFNSLLFEIRCT